MVVREYFIYEFGFMVKENSYFMLFLLVKYVFLGKDILCFLLDIVQDVNIVEQCWWEINYVMSVDNIKKMEWIEYYGNYYVIVGEFEDFLFCMVDLEIVCFDMMYVDLLKGNSYNGVLVIDFFNLYLFKG